MDTLLYWSNMKLKKLKKKIKMNFLFINFLKIITWKIFVSEHSAWRQMKENYQNYLPFRFHWKPQFVGGDHRLPYTKWKPCFFEICQKVEDWLTFLPINTKRRPTILWIGRNKNCKSFFARVFFIINIIKIQPTRYSASLQFIHSSIRHRNRIRNWQKVKYDGCTSFVP